MSAAPAEESKAWHFRPLDVNLWHPTEQRRTETGHGVNSAFDNSRNTNFDQSYSVPVRDDNQYTGGVSFYFGLENWIQNPNNNEYERYGTNAQYGFAELDNHRDLASNGDIGNNYNTPGGAHGSLITDPFDLSGSEYADKPTLYYNYFLDTEGQQSDNNSAMYDSARTWIWGLPEHQLVRPVERRQSNQLGNDRAHRLTRSRYKFRNRQQTHRGPVQRD